MLTQTTIERLRAMRLRGHGRCPGTAATQPELQSLTFEERFGLLVDQEWMDRQNRRLARLLKEAKLRLAACMEEIDYQHPRGLDRAVMHSLAPASGFRLVSTS